MRRGIRTMLIALAVFVLAGCSDPFGSAYDYGRIEVVAMDQFGDPVFGVTLTLYGRGRHYAYAATDVAGRHVFEFVPFGGFGIEAGPPPGYAFDSGLTHHAYVDLEEGEEARVDLSLTRLPDETDAGSTSMQGVR